MNKEEKWYILSGYRDPISLTEKQAEWYSGEFWKDVCWIVSGPFDSYDLAVRNRDYTDAQL